MAAVVQGGHLPAQYARNTDPGVYEPECDFYGDDPAAPTGYPDTEDFLLGHPANCGEPAPPEEEAAPAPAPEVAPTDQALPLAKDYVGMGGPKTCPLYTPSAFENPKLAAVPVTRTILDEIFLEPTDNQLNAYNRVILKGQVEVNKNRLKWAISIHFYLLFLMLTKLSPDILDRLDIFVLELEELFVPKPLFWEWTWLLSIPVTFFGLSATKTTNLKAIQQFLIGTLLFSLLPILVGMGLHFYDCYEFLTEGLSENVVVWQGYPYSVLWYAFFFVALQVHLYEIYFGNCLMQAWLPTAKKQA